MDLESLILETLQKAGPMRADELADELTHRRRLKSLPEFDGLIGLGAVKTALRSLALQGVALDEGGNWNYVPPQRPAEAKPSGRTVQASLF